MSTMRKLNNSAVNTMTEINITEATLADLPEFGVGHATNLDAMTGCTAFVARDARAEGVVCGVDVRGGAPATRETDLLRPENMVQKVNAVMIGGGSAFGLEAAEGAMRVLADADMGFHLAGVCVPIVPAACLFDLLVGKPKWPDAAMGAEATRAALQFCAADHELAQGSVGAGTGATTNKIAGASNIMKGGFGVSGLRAGKLVVLACVAVNAYGRVVHNFSASSFLDLCAVQSGVIASEIAPSLNGGCAGQGNNGTEKTSGTTPSPNTTLGVVLTNAALSQAQATKVSQMAHDGFARAIMPVHTLNDGDAIFTMASGTVSTPYACAASAASNSSATPVTAAASAASNEAQPADVNLVGQLAAIAMQQAILNSAHC